jgi:hypothetical protein
MHGTIEQVSGKVTGNTRASWIVVCLFAAVGIALSLLVMLWSADAFGIS